MEPTNELLKELGIEITMEEAKRVANLGPRDRLTLRTVKKGDRYLAKSAYNGVLQVWDCSLSQPSGCFIVIEKAPPRRFLLEETGEVAEPWGNLHIGNNGNPSMEYSPGPSPLLSWRELKPTEEISGQGQSMIQDAISKWQEDDRKIARIILEKQDYYGGLLAHWARMVLAKEQEQNDPPRKAGEAS